MLLAFIARLQKWQSKRYFVIQSSSKLTKIIIAAMHSSGPDTKAERKTMITLGLNYKLSLTI